MSCCGGGASRTPIQTQTIVPTASPLDGVSENQKVWVQYNGGRRASFGVKGNFTGTVYRIDGPGHKIQVHISDLRLFKRSGRGRDFVISVAPPPADNGQEKIEPTVTKETFQGGKPELAQIERLDARAMAHG